MLDALFIRYFRWIHPRHIGYRSPHKGYAAVVDEIHYEHRHLDDTRLLAAVHATLTDMMGGGPVVRLIGRLGRRFPAGTAKALTAMTPTAFRWLVGPIRRSGPGALEVGRCRFLAETSPEICLRVCQGPTQRFFAERLHVRAELAPDHERGSCRIRFAGGDR